MILEEIFLRGWRCFREPHSFHFIDGINLVHGPNGAGKSTLFEALTRGLFDKYTSAAGPIKSILPLDSALAPEVSITFAEDGHRYRIRKRFVSKPECELFDLQSGRDVRMADGDAAENRVRNIVGGVTAGRDAGRRGIAQALWYLQTDDALPEREGWSEGVRRRIAGLVQTTVKTPDEEKLQKAIVERLGEYYTPTRRVKDGGRIGLLTSELQQHESRRAELQSELEGFDQARRALVASMEAAEERRRGLEQARKQRDKIKEKVDLSVNLERAKTEQEQRVQRDSASLKLLRRDLHEIEAEQTKIRDIAQPLRDAREKVAKQEAQTNAKFGEAEIAREESRKLETERVGMRTGLGRLAALERLNRLHKDREVLQTALSDLAALELKLSTIESELKAIIVPNDKEFQALELSLQTLRATQAKRETVGIYVGFDFIDPAHTVTAAPSEIAPTANGEYLISAPTEFRIADVGTVRVHGGGPSLADLDSMIATSEYEIEAFLKRFGAALPEDLERRRAERSQKLEIRKIISEEHSTKLNPLHAVLGHTPPGRAEVEQELLLISKGIAQEEANAGDIAVALEFKGGEAIRNASAAAKLQADDLETLIESKRKVAEAANQARIKTIEATVGTKNLVTRYVAEHDVAERRIAELAAAHGGLPALRQAIESAERTLSSAEDLLRTMNNEYNEKVTGPRKLLEVEERAVAELSESLNAADREASRCRGKLESVEERNTYADLDDCQAAIDLVEHRLEGEKLKAGALTVLRDLYVAYETEQARGMARPVARIIDPWLDSLTAGEMRCIHLDAGLLPTAVSLTHHDGQLPQECLSFGTKEQMVTLLRLAIAVLVSEDQRNLVVLDDRFVNADGIRTQQLKLILLEVGQKCQVIIATCDPARYSGIGAHEIRVREDGLIPVD